MLGKKRKQKKIEEAKSKVETILGAGTVIEGDISTKGSLRIEGKVKGNIKAEGDLYIGENGKIEKEIKARNVIIAGSVNGNIIAAKKIELLPAGKLKGDIQTKVLKIEEGAVFNGSSKPLNDDYKTIKISDKVKREVASIDQEE
ncbi:MAG: bactofilin family protein [Halanaerobiales bacterium]